MIAFFRLLELAKVGLQILRGQEGGAVDTLQSLITLVPFPVRSGNARHLKRFRVNPSRGVDVGTRAEINQIAKAVAGQGLTCLLLDQLNLEVFSLPGKVIYSFLLGYDGGFVL